MLRLYSHRFSFQIKWLLCDIYLIFFPFTYSFISLFPTQLFHSCFLLPKRVLDWLHFVDKAGIYLLIAGSCKSLASPRIQLLYKTTAFLYCTSERTYFLKHASRSACTRMRFMHFIHFIHVSSTCADTPFLVILFPDKPAWSVWLLALVWVVATVGILVAAILPPSKLKARISLSLYLVMGWGALITYSVSAEESQSPFHFSCSLFKPNIAKASCCVIFLSVHFF